MKTFYLVQYSKLRQLPFIYSFENDGVHTYVHVMQNTTMELQTPLLMGILTKHNKRGYTIQSHILAEKPINVFLSNSEFIRFNYTEYKKYINNVKINA